MVIKKTSEREKSIKFITLKDSNVFQKSTGNYRINCPSLSVFAEICLGQCNTYFSLSAITDSGLLGLGEILDYNAVNLPASCGVLVF